VSSDLRGLSAAKVVTRDGKLGFLSVHARAPTQGKNHLSLPPGSYHLRIVLNLFFVLFTLFLIAFINVITRILIFRQPKTFWTLAVVTSKGILTLSWIKF